MNIQKGIEMIDDDDDVIQHEYDEMFLELDEQKAQQIKELLWTFKPKERLALLKVFTKMTYDELKQNEATRDG